MKRKIIPISLALIFIFTMLPQFPVPASAAEQMSRMETLDVLNELLRGLDFYSQESEIALWDDESISMAVWSKLNSESFDDSLSYSQNLGIQYQYIRDEDIQGDIQFDLDQIRKFTQDTFGREFPDNVQSELLHISGNKMILMCTGGEEGQILSVQDYVKQGDLLIAVGVATRYSLDYTKFVSNFQAVFRENPSSVYGYTLVSLGRIEENQDFGNLTARASSVLREETITYYAENVLDGDLSTSWVEGVPGTGVNEWIKLETVDGSNVDVSAITFSVGYQKNDELFKKNGRPDKVLIECEGGYRQEEFLYGKKDTVVLDQPVKTSWIKITILEASAGAEYDDTCICEIRPHGMDTAAYFQEYLENNPVEDVPEDSGIVVYSDYANLSIRKGSEITLRAGIHADGEPTADVSGLTFQVEDTSVLSVTATDVEDHCRYVKLKGLTEGTTTVVFNDSNTGHMVKVPVTVYDNNYLSYTLNSVPVQNIEKYPTNIYNVNGLYIDNYSFTVNDDQSARVSFDVYNTNYTYGTVEVFYANGELRDAVLINKMTSSNTSIKEALFDNAGHLVRDIIDGDLLSYRQESGFSKMTPVSVEIPPNGYIKICTDPENSLIVGFVNSVDWLMSLSSLAGDINNFNANSNAFSEKLTAKLVKDKGYAELLKDGNNAAKHFWKNAGKEVFRTSKSMGSFADTVSKNIDELNLGRIIADTAEDYGWDVGEKVFSYFSGPVRTALNIMFSAGKVENLILQQDHFIQSEGAGSIFIQNQGGGLRACQQIRVESENGFSSDTALNVFTVTLDATYLDVIKNRNPDVYEAITNGKTYTYNISLLKNGEETQPDGKATVYIPIPEDLKELAYTGEALGKVSGKVKVYRIEENGNLTQMDAEIEDGCLVFTTDHFSLYTVVGYDSAEDTASNIAKTVITCIAVVLVASIGIALIVKKE